MKISLIRTISRWAISISLLALVTACATYPQWLRPMSAEDASEPALQQGAPGSQQSVPPTPPSGDTITVDLERFSPEDGAQPRHDDCPGMDDKLVQIAKAPDPEAMATQMGFKVQGANIQVVLVLADADTAFLKDFDVDVGTPSGTKVQAFVPFARLCELAQTEQVLAIVLPGQSFIQ